MNRALLFLNGKKSKKTPNNFQDYQLILCTDGAYNKLKDKNIPITLIIGDLDSLNELPINSNIQIIKIEDQNTTDFDKAILYLVDNNFTSIDVWGASGKEYDHFLGNLSTALRFQNKINIVFFDNYYQYFFAKKEEILFDVLNKKISLYPFPFAYNIISKGLQYPLTKKTLRVDKEIGIRNKAIKNNVTLTFSKGNLLVFIER